MAAPAMAQSDASAPADNATATEPAQTDIVVTAQRRSESLLRVPIAVSALSGNELERRGLTRPDALATFVPNLQVNDSRGGEEPNFTLRGVGVGSDFSSTQAAPVGVYVDDAYIAFRAGTGAQMFDLERVEVLRGPQGTLFGRNTTGGAINFISRKPKLEGSNGYLEAGYGNFDHYSVDAAVESTLVDDMVGVRVAVGYDNHDGFNKNRFPGGHDLGSADSLRSRLSLRVRPSGTFDANLRLFLNRSRPYQPGAASIGTLPGGVNPLTGYSRRNLGFYEVESDRPVHNLIDSQGGALTLKWDAAPNLVIQSLTAYDTAKSDLGQDTEVSPISVIDTKYHTDYKEFSQEIRFTYNSGALKFQGGGYYGRDEIKVSNRYTVLRFLADLGIPADPTLAAGGIVIQQDYRQIRTSKAVFGQFDVSPTDRLTITAGLRYTWDTARYADGRASLNDFNLNPLVFTIGTPGSPVDKRGENRALTGRAAINYTFPDGQLIYASFSRGYRAGTFNGSAYFSPTQIEFVPPEKVNAYELGAKGRFLDGALSLAAAAFYYDYTNQQLQDIVGPVIFLRSAGGATVKGAELEATARLSPAVTLSGSIGYSDGKFAQLSLQGIDLSGNRLPFVPKITASARADLRLGKLAGGEITVSPSLTYSSSHWFTPYNAALGNATLLQDGFAIVDLVAEWSNGPWSARLWGKNIFQKEYYSYASNLSTFGYNFFIQGQPRTFGVSVRRTF